MTSTNSLSDLSLKQLNEMNSKAKQLVELMKKGIVEFIFKKKSTGKMRRAKGTLKKNLIPKESQRKTGRPKKRPEDLVIYFDVDKQAIRSFKDYLLKKVYKTITAKTPKKSDISKSNKSVNSTEDRPTQKDKKQDKENGKED